MNIVSLLLMHEGEDFISVQISSMRDEDLDEVTALALSTPQIDTATEVPQFYSNETLQTWIRDPNGILLVARVYGELAGFRLADYNPSSRDGHLHLMIVKENFRRRGVGTQLLDYTLSRLEELGCNHVYCEVAEDNPEALEFFKKHGFEIGRKFHRVERILPR